jgi:hypothetical protein
VTITGTTVSSPALELSQFSNSPPSTACNLPMAQTSFDDTAASVATNPLTGAQFGDQYLGYAIQYGSLTAVYTMTYQASSASWTAIPGQLLNYPNAVYVKSAMEAVGSTSYPKAYMFINPGTLGQVDFFSSATLPATVSYGLAGTLPAPTPLPGQNYDNPRIDAPEYVDSSVLSTVPVWEQYTSAIIMGSDVQSLIYWNDVPN